MIDEEITFRERGYYSMDLKPHSHKEVWAVCEGKDCQREEGRGRWAKFYQCSDLCRACSLKNRPVQKCETPNKKLPWIDDDITYAEKGYRSTELKPKSSMFVWAVCANPGCEREGGRGRWVMFCQCAELCHLCAVRTDEFRAKIGDMNRGKNNSMYGRNGESAPRWKGGITPERKRFFNSLEHRQWRISIFERDGYTCQECGQLGKNLNAHHILPYRDYKDMEYSLNVDNGITLCEECHAKVNGKEYDFVERYQKIVNRKIQML